MPLVRIESLGDPRLEPYRHLKQTNLTRWSGRFIAEGKLVVERLLASRYDTESVLLSERRLALLEELPVPHACEVFVVSEELAKELTGFNFHAGVMACGLRGATRKLDDVMAPLVRVPAGSDEAGILCVACPRMTDPDNLGTLIRLCRAFGVAALLLGEGCCDPFSRRTLRVSMGNAFQLPTIECGDLAGDLEYLRQAWGFTLTATVLDPDATPLQEASADGRDLLLLGNEAHGLESQWISLCDRRITIPMESGADSLNVSIAAGICLHWLRQAAHRRS